MGHAYMIRAGQIRSVAIPPGGLRIERGGLAGDRPSEELVALPGDEWPHWRSHTLAVVRHIATTMTPWATWWVAAKFRRDDFGIMSQRVV